ncbi:KpsF/GutQ family sugar-phosphate isomerase [Marinicella litoralis]|uniref:Arabinose 5-phosphate isomerase n=1 Tax=Marinicella litoralis TaxID=644220 RepID=A0A4R6XGD1_9GAMM|nr:KpsF/GutQ family sugar-phosphate isomerase [Marinicella litoralis]TDR18442.1 arabinose-5-phosphate isomerase [Marinicella litoralis]
MKKFSSSDIVRLSHQVFDVELNGLKQLKQRVGDEFVAAIELIMACKGHVVVIGMGKSGHIGNKISATLASTGTPAFFVHPGEASHGDLGMITSGDLILAISNSGETEEVLTILPLIKRMGAKLISMTGKPNSNLAKNSNVHLDISVTEEACPLGLAPTASTTATLVMGDALAVTLLEMRGFTKEDFAMSHPAGSLGKKLLLGIEDVMRTGEDIPRVPLNADFAMALLEMNQKGLGMTAVVHNNGQVAGVFTDGDLRRTLDDLADLKEKTMVDLATPNPVLIHYKKMAVEAAQIMEAYKIHSLLVVNDDEILVGALNIHDLLRAGVV